MSNEILLLVSFSASPSCDRLVLPVEDDRCDEPHPPIQDHPQSDGRRPLRTSQGSLQHLEGRDLYISAPTRNLLFTAGLQTKQEESGKTNPIGKFSTFIGFLIRLIQKSKDPSWTPQLFLLKKKKLLVKMYQ